MKQHLLFWLLLIVFMLVGPALEAQTVHRLHIKGLQRIGKDVVSSKISLKKGATYSDSKVTRDVRELFKTGFFFDIKVTKSQTPSGLTLTYSFVEKPMISRILFKGNKEFEEEQLLEKLPIKNLRFFDADQILKFIDEIKKMYEEEGYFLVQIDYKVEKASQNQQNLVFYIKEGKKVQIDEVQFFGNENVETSLLQEFIGTRTSSGFLSFFSGGNAYKKDVLQEDVQRIQYYYLNEGYVQMKIDPPQVFVSQDKTSISVIFKIQEGKRFFVRNMDFKNNAFIPKEDLRKSLKLKKGKPYSYGKMRETLLNLKSRYGEYGYAFANIIPYESFRGDQVDVVFQIQLGEKVNFGNFSIKGNQRTRDYVILRELSIEEGKLYNEKQKIKSMNNVKRLGFFEEVNFNNKFSKTNAKEVDVEIILKERLNTGTLALGGSYSAGSGFAFEGQFLQNNFMGKGQVFDLTFHVGSRISNFFDFSFTEPYFLGSKYSMSLDLARSSFSRSFFSRRRNTVGFHSGRRLRAYTRMSLGYSYNSITTKFADEKEAFGDIVDIDLANKNRSVVRVGLVYDRRNDRLIPTKGYYARALLNYTGFGGGGLSYSKLSSRLPFL